MFVDALLVKMMDNGPAIFPAVHPDVTLVLDSQTDLHSLQNIGKSSLDWQFVQNGIWSQCVLLILDCREQLCIATAHVVNKR